MSAASVPQVLRDAAELIERDGWCQNFLMTADGRLCMLGAIGRAADDGGFEADAAEAMADYVDVDFADLWNDVPGRTVTEVLAALRGAADAWEAAHDVETMTRVATGQSIGDEPWDHPGEPIAMSEEVGDA